MEILNHNYSSLVLNIGLVITGMTILLLMVMTVVHWQADRHQKQTATFTRVNEPLVMSYLEGTMPKTSVVKAIKKKPLKAMNLLTGISGKLHPTMQSQLSDLFAELPGVDKEISALDSSPLMKRRIQAAERLAHLKSEASTEALLDALEDDVIAVRYYAARSLALHGDTESIEPTLLALDVEHEINWFRIIEILLDYGPPATPTLLAVLENPEDKYSNNILNVAIRTLGIFKESQALQPLTKLLSHPDFSIRHNAAHALGDIGDPAAITPVAELSHDPDWTVRNEAIEAIGKLHAETQIPVLEEALTDSSWWVRYSAAQALHSLGPSGIEKLNEIMKSTHSAYAYDMCRQVLSEHDIHDTTPNLP